MSDVSHYQLAQQIGYLQGEMTGVKTDLKVVQGNLNAIRDDLRIIRTVIDERKGGWKAVLTLASLATTVGAIASVLTNWLMKGGV